MSQYDVNVLQGASLTGETKVLASLGWDFGGNQAVGIHKLCQQFVALFLTQVGSCLYDETRGAGFMLALYNGQLRTDADVSLHFNLAASDIGDYLRATYTDDTPADEQYGIAELLSIDFQFPTLLLGVRLTSVAGTSRQVILPVTGEV